MPAVRAPLQAAHGGGVPTTQELVHLRASQTNGCSFPPTWPRAADGTMWPVAFALTGLTAAEEARIAELVKKAAS
jgi:hypothetical protein